MSASDQLAERLAERPAVDVAADLTVTVDGHDLRVESYTDRIVVDAPTLAAAVVAVRDLPNRGSPLAAGGLLAAADLTVLLRVDGVEVARLGADLAGVAYRHASVRPVGLLRALVG